MVYGAIDLHARTSRIRIIDGDGRVLSMRVPDANGSWKAHPVDARLLIARRPGDLQRGQAGETAGNAERERNEAQREQRQPIRQGAPGGSAAGRADRPQRLRTPPGP